MRPSSARQRSAAHARLEGGDGRPGLVVAAIVNGVVYVGSYYNGVDAFDAATGQQLWRFQTGNVVSSSPAVANGLVYAASWDGTLYALDARTGALRWRHASIESTPTIADGVVYVSGDDHMFYALGLPAAVRQS